MNRTIFMDRLKELRKEKFMTQRDFADAYVEHFNGLRESKSDRPDMFGTIQAWEQGKTMPNAEALYNICELLECDADYLLGRIDARTHNINDIIDNLGLSDKATNNLLKNKKIYLGDYLYDNFGFNFPYYGNDPEIPIKQFWNCILGSEMYDTIPKKWYEMAIAIFFDNAIKQEVEQLREIKPELPPREKFIEMFNVYYESDFSGDETPPNGLSAEKIYDDNKDIAQEWVKEYYNKAYSSYCEDYRKRHLVAIGSSGDFDRTVENYFHEMAKNYVPPNMFFEDDI